MNPLRPRPIKIRLSPLCDGHYTRLRLCASLPTPMPTGALLRLCNLLSIFSGERVQFVLSAGIQDGPWCDSWVASIAYLPTRHAQLRFERPRRRVAHEL